jgi:hypothetical protein
MKSAHESPTSSEVDPRRARWLSRRWSMSCQGNEYLNADGFNVVIFPWYDGWRNAITSIPNGVTSFSKYMYPTADAAKRAASREIFFPEETATAMTIPEHNPPPTFRDIEAALLGRLGRRAAAEPGFFSHTPVERIFLCVQWLARFLAPADGMVIDGLYPTALDSICVHVIGHLSARRPFSKSCVICAPLPRGVTVGPDGAGEIRVWVSDGVKIRLNDRNILWHLAKCSSPAALQVLKEIILNGDEAVAAKERIHG